MNRFIAIGVREGDAFVLTRGRTTALVDGGKSVLEFPLEFWRATRSCRVDYVVCTHNDSDHANGIFGLLRVGLNCKEVWLPATWADTLPDLAAAGAVSRIADECSMLVSREGQTFADLGEAAVDEEFEVGDSEADAEIGDDATPRQATPSEGMDGLDQWLGWEAEGPSAWLALLQQTHRGTAALSQIEQYLRAIAELDVTEARVFVEAVAAGVRIAGIASAAYARGIPIRWFRFGRRVAGGAPGFLLPVNSCEVAFLRPRTRLPLLLRLALTTVNRKSLVFYSPPGNDASGVLFCSDSDLQFEPPLPTGIGLATAPHHGSESNAVAYDRIDQGGVLTRSSVWARSESRSRSGATFVGRRERKFCTWCRQPDTSKHDVILWSEYRIWRPQRGILPCSCG